MSGLRTVRRALGVALVVWATALPGAGPLAGQAGQDGGEEGRLLRTAAILESRGELERAEELLREHLRDHPTATAVLFALERIARSRGELAAVLPAIEAYLEEAPGTGGIRYLKLRLLAEMDSLGALREEGEAWIAAAPGEPEPYREVARIYARALGPERALEVLLRGSAAVREPGGLALETGDLLVELGRVEEGARAWARAVGPDGAAGAAVLRRIERLPGDRREAAGPLLEELGEDGAPAGRLRAAALIALETGLGRRATELAGRALAGLEEAPARGFLLELGHRATQSARGGGEGAQVAVWAYRTLRERTPDPPEALALDRRIAEAALAAGDSASAVAARRRVAEALPRGSPERRAALAGLIRLQGVGDEGEDLEALLATFRREYPDAPETDELAATLASARWARGDREGALRALEGTRGPRSALERAYLHLDRGEVEEGREALLEAIPGLPPARATGRIELVGLLDRVGPEAARRAGRAAALAHRGRPGEGAALVRELEGVPLEERPPLLALGAGLAEEAGDPAGAARLRKRIVTEFPGAPEWPGAALALARHLVETPGGAEEAARILEALILERPGSAVVPAARRELERIRGGEHRPAQRGGRGAQRRGRGGSGS